MVIYYFHNREVGFTRRFMSCHGVVRLVSSNGYIYYFHGREVGLLDDLVFWVCHSAVRSVYPTVYELPRCREVGFIQRLYILFPRP